MSTGLSSNHPTARWRTTLTKQRLRGCLQRVSPRTLEGHKRLTRHSTIWLLTVPLLIGCPSAKDHDEANAVLKHVQTNFLFREATTGQSIYFQPGHWSTGLNVYGVRSAPDQDRIVELV